MIPESAIGKVSYLCGGGRIYFPVLGRMRDDSIGCRNGVCMSHNAQYAILKKCYKLYSVQYTLYVTQLAIMLLHMYGCVFAEFYSFVIHPIFRGAF